MSGEVYASGVALATASFLITLLIISPMFWHYRNRNIGATVLVGWIVYLNFQSFVNALIWPTDDIQHWFTGVGLCDVEVKLQVASEVATPAALYCVLRALAKVMDTARTTVVQSRSLTRRNYAIDITICVVPPVLQMIFHYVVQPERYYIFAISGCIPAVSATWVTILLIYIPPMLWTLVDAYYAILIVIRLHRYRVTFNSILMSNNTSKSRFMRLYLLCVLWVLAFVPLQAFVLFKNLSLFKSAFEWPQVHSPDTWSAVTTVPSGGVIYYDRYIWLTSGIVVFFFFGLGKEAVASYRSAMVSLGMAKILPRLSPDYEPTSRATLSSTVSSFGSKAKLFFTRGKSSASDSTWSTDSRGSTICTKPFTEKTTPRSTVIEDPEKQQYPHSIKPSGAIRLASIFTLKRSASPPLDRHFVFASIDDQSTTLSSVIGGDPSPTLVRDFHPHDPKAVVVRSEVRQGSESTEVPRATTPSQAV